MNDNESSSRSTAANPDLDWSQVRETILMLGLAIAQIESAMKDSGESVESLANSFTTMSGTVKVIADAAEDLPDSPAKQCVTDNCRIVSERVNEAIIAFQFYDRMVQRLSHVAHSVDDLGGLIADSRRLYNPHEWVGMQQKIRSKYTMDEERVMFDAIMQGMTVKQALARYLEIRQQKQAQHVDVELF